MVGVRAHASIGADTVGIEEFKHRCSMSGVIFFSASLRCGQSYVELARQECIVLEIVWGPLR